MTTALSPVRFDAPLVNPAPGGLYSVTSWTEAAEGEALRWLPSGVEIRAHNYGGEDAFGVWEAPWNAATADLTEDDVKTGERPEWLDPFEPVTVWASDECDLTAPSRAEVRTRAAQNLRLLEPVAVERKFAARLLADAGTPDGVASVVEAVGAIEDAFAVTNTLGFIHARPGFLAPAVAANLVVRSSAGLKTPGGHSWVFGGGYVDGLADTIVATSLTFGWRGEVALRDAPDLQHNRFVAIAERSVVVGYEALIGAVTVS